MYQAIWKHFSCHFCRMCQMFAFLLRVFCQNLGFQPLFLPAYPSVFPFWICLSLSVYVCAVMATFPAPGVILRFAVSDQFIISSWLTHLPFITQSTKVDIPQLYINQKYISCQKSFLTLCSTISAPYSLCDLSYPVSNLYMSIWSRIVTYPPASDHCLPNHLNKYMVLYMYHMCNMCQ